MTTHVNAVTAFIQETNRHTAFNIGTLLDSIAAIKDIHLVAIANGCAVSGELRARCNASPSITLIETQQNIGVPAAWNAGLDALSPGDGHVLIVNDDVWFDVYCVEQMVAALDTMTDTAVIGLEGQACRKTDRGGFPLEKKHFGKKNRGPTAQKVIPVSKADGFFFALSRDFLAKTGFRFDTRYTPAFCEELDLAFTARSLGYRVRIVSGLDEHYQHVHGVSASDRTISYLDTAITTGDLSKRNMRLFADKWAADMKKLIGP